MRQNSTVRKTLVIVLAVSVGIVVTNAIAASRHAAAAHGGSGFVSPVGKIGPLNLEMSTAVAVQAFAGRADFIGTGTYKVPGDPNFTALGYDCNGDSRSPQRIDPTAYHPSHVYCRTVYDINDKTNRLSAFYTSSPAFHTRYGTHPGSSQAYANAHEDALPEFQCHQGLSRGTGEAELLMGNQGGHPRTVTVGGLTYTTAVVGGTVIDFALESQVSAIGLLFC